MSQPSSTINEHQDYFQLKNYIIKQLGIGSASNVYATIPKVVANRILSRYPTHLTKKATCNRLRASLRATKIAHQDFSNEGNDFKAEIECYQDLLPRPHIVNIIDSDKQSNSWVSLELLAGGTLHTLENQAHQQFITAGESPLPVAFAWHLIAELSAALLELHHAMVANEFLPEALQYIHGDMQSENILLRFPGKFKDYPDIILTDLGKPQFLAPEDDSEIAETFYKTQADEVFVAMADLDKIMKGLVVQDPRLLIALQALSHFREPGDDVHDKNEMLRGCLRYVMNAAVERREELYLPLRSDLALGRLEVLVSNEVLGRGFLQLS